jgi:alginate O-acetyltransferase complex protein AlgI
MVPSMALISAPALFVLLGSFVAFNLAPPRRRWVILLLASYAFYFWAAGFSSTLVLAALTALDFLAALAIQAARSDRSRNFWFWLAVAANVGPMAASKYLSFEVVSLVGVSFYALQGISYLADVRLEKIAAERHPGLFALYMSFWPKVVMGPIERVSDLIPQLGKDLPFRYEEVRSGLLLIGVGLFKKVVIADHLARRVDPVFDSVRTHSGLIFVAATYLYALQIYFDFAGYSDLARGAARVFGIELSRNFDGPYWSRSIPEFWRRWHITLSRWLLDYVFAPLQLTLRRWRTIGTVAALVGTFVVSGLWHGLAPGFLVWGCLHGLYMASSVLWRHVRPRWLDAPSLGRVMPWLRTFLTFHMVCLAWIFFRARRLDDAFYVLSHLFAGIVGIRSFFLSSAVAGLVLWSALMLVGLAKLICRDRCPADLLFSRPRWLRWTVYYVMAVYVVLLQARGESSFIYFRF